MSKPYLIAQILLERGMPEFVIKEITALDERELDILKSIELAKNHTSSP
ncbi:hypothetical protein [Peribacillus sp. SCS-155]